MGGYLWEFNLLLGKFSVAFKSIRKLKMKPKIVNVSIVGTGILGTQIAIQSALHGCQVSCYDTDDKAFYDGIKRIENRIKNSDRKPILSLEEIKEGATRVKICKRFEDALQEADLVIECAPEDLSLKRALFKKIDVSTPPATIFATNSSSICISKIENVTQRPENCLNIHFYSMDLGRNMADIMGGTKTSVATIETCKQWVRSVGCVPIEIKKEISGFFVNRISWAIRREALNLWAEGYADFKDIDRAWMIYSGMSQGPFGAMDAVGLDIVYAMALNFYDESKDLRDCPPESLKTLVDRKQLGQKTGKGFYDYPNPEYRRPDFLKGRIESILIKGKDFR